MTKGRGLRKSQKTERDLPQPGSEKNLQDFVHAIAGKGSKVYTLRKFEQFCTYLRTEDDQPLKIEPFQRKILRDHFGGAIEEVVVIPKKNGKTTLFAALALFHLLVWKGAEVIIVAASEEQAGIMFRLAMEMVERSKMTAVFDVRDGYKVVRLQGQKKGPRIRVLPADPKTVDGVLPTLALVDELHRHPNGDLYGVLRDGVDARDGRMVTMSTAGLKEDSALGQLRATACLLPSFKRRGTYSHAKSADGSFVLHEWSLTNEDDLDNLKLVKKANPLRTQTIEKLRRRKNSPTMKMSPGRWARFACGVWTEGEDPWIEAKLWDSLAVDIGQVKKGESVWCAVNYGVVNPAIVLAAKRPDGAAAVKAEIFEGETNYAEVERRLLEMHENYDLQEVAYDAKTFLRSSELLKIAGLPMMETPHSPERMTIVSSTLYRLAQTRKIRHDGDKKFRTQVLAGAVKESERGPRLVQSFRTRALIAMAIACHQATYVGPESVYETRGLEHG